MGVTTSKPDQKSLSYRIRDELKQDILQGVLLPGTQLRQESLAKRFNSSRIPVREALRQLEVEGLVKSKLNRGAIVSTPNLNDVCDLLEIRIALECRAAKLAVPNMTSEDIARLTEILNAYSLAKTPAECAENNRQFHLALCLPANNKQLTALIKQYCMSTSSPYANFHLDMTTATDIEAVHQDHYAILDACKARDVEAVVTILENHIKATKLCLLKFQQCV
ncbi:GntR family transcriptional regulator [Zophobihabitans entericus]|uniref:GntR family transcriptional regulator n=1 Tax=Zophobihabitans entericus TaxID=1635327 RepID=A0A6G9IDH7_9GAMM|nr:GntR family transcriptional regulator [Zophobihabitans entericus]QIQ21869.1 GntR family transcriptional regulator [Zophobihabitans entericus]